MSSHGGARSCAGRKLGIPNKATLEREIRAKHGVQAAIETGVMPLDVLMTVMRGGEAAEAITERQYQAARDAAPYLHPRLAIATLKGDAAAPLHINHTADANRRIRKLLAQARGELPAAMAPEEQAP